MSEYRQTKGAWAKTNNETTVASRQRQTQCY